MGILQNSNAIPTAGDTDFYEYQITKSLRFNGTNQALEKTWGSAASDDDKKAISVWIKRTGAGGTNSAIGSTTNTKICSANDFNQLEMNTNNPTGYNDSFGYIFNSGNNANWSQARLRDASSWYHLVWIWNSDESTDTDRVKVYLNGKSIGTINDANYWNNKSGDPFPSSGMDTTFGKNGNEMHIARYQYDDAGWWGGQMADFIMIDGAASVSDFGETKNGVWIPKDPSGLTFGNNGFWLKFTNTSNAGEDFSGNDNDFTTIGTISTHDFLIDTPTFDSSSNGGNFATFGPLWKTPDMTFSEGNLKYTTSTNQRGCMSNWGIPLEGKWYWEYTQVSWAGSDGDSSVIGVNVATVDFTASRGGNPTAYGWSAYDGAKVVTGTESSYGDSWRTGDVLGVAVDRVNDTIQFYKNGSGQGTFSIPSTGDLFPWFGSGGGSSSAVGIVNFGQDSSFAGQSGLDGSSANASDDNGYGDFYDTPPSGFLALCAANLLVANEVDPASTDDNFPQKLFGAILYTGNGGTNNITGLGFKPDLTWIKIRNTASNGPLVDSSRGTSKIVFSQINDAEVTSANLTAFGTDGFSLAGGLASYDPNFNGNTNTYVGWNWRANGGTTSSGSGDLTSTHQVDPSGGFSIVKAVGDGSGSGDKTVTHGMSAAPDCILAKNLDSGFNWDTYWSSGLTATSYSIRLNTSDNQLSGRWGTVNSSIFTCKYNYTWVGSDNFIYYCFRNIEGYIKVGTYKGNGNNDGAFVFTGFKPAWLLLREVAVDNWGNYDDKRIGQNNDDGKGNAVLYADTHDDEENQASRAIDLLSNGFKLRTSNATFNNSGGTYVYLAMAHNPFKYSLGR